MGDSTGTQNQQALYGCTSCCEEYSWHAVDLRVDDAGDCWCENCWEYTDYVTTLGRWCELAPFIPQQTKRIKELEARNKDQTLFIEARVMEVEAAYQRIKELEAEIAEKDAIDGIISAGGE